MIGQNIIPGCYYKLGDNIVKAYLSGKNEIRFDNSLGCNDFLVDSFYALTPQSDTILFPEDERPIDVEPVPLCTEFFEEQGYFSAIENAEIETYWPMLASDIISLTGRYWWVGGSDDDCDTYILNYALWIAEADVKYTTSGKTRKTYFPLLRAGGSVMRLSPIAAVDQLQQLMTFFYEQRRNLDFEAAHDAAAIMSRVKTELKFTFNYLNNDKKDK